MDCYMHVACISGACACAKHLTVCMVFWCPSHSFARANGIDRVEYIILDLTPVPHMDSMGAHFLEELNEVSNRGGCVLGLLTESLHVACKHFDHMRPKWVLSVCGVSRPKTPQSPAYHSCAA